MFTIRYPSLMWMVRELAGGMFPIWLKDDPIPKMVIKASKETILTAKMNRGFAIYLVPYSLGGADSYGFVVAFFDDEIHPITLIGAIIQEFSGEGVRQLLLSESVEVYFFDELNREMLGYRSKLAVSDAYKTALVNAEFPSLEGLDQSKILNLIADRFSNSGPAEDTGAIAVTFEDSLFPENYVFLDLREENHSYKGTPGYSHTFLERPEPGEFQERDVINLLQRTFPPSSIYLAPLRVHDKEEVVDVMVVTEESVLLIQAKDSPNIERVLSNSLARKKATTHGALKKAISQARGAIGYMRRKSPMSVIMDGVEVEINYEGKQVYSLLIIKELFLDEYAAYTSPMLKLSKDTGVPCIALSYSELHQYTTHLIGDQAFFEAFMRVFNYGVEHGEFPRLRLHHPS